MRDDDGHDLDRRERERVAPYVTDPVGPVFALTGLPEVVKGALFARYSRSPKSLRRLLLDEFLPDEAGVARRRRCPSARRGPRPSTPGSSPSTATTRSPSSAAPTSRSRGPPTCSPRSCSGGAWRATWSSQRATSPSPTAPAARTATTAPRPIMAHPELGPAYTGTLDDAFAAYSDLLPRMVAHVGPRGARRPGDPGGRPRARGPGAGARPAAGPSPGGDHGERRDLRLGAGLRGHAGADGAPTRCPRPASAPPACSPSCAR